MTLNEFGELLQTIGVPVSRYESDTQKHPYIVYNLYKKEYEKANNRIDDVILHIQVDYYTTDDEDVNPDRIETLLDENTIPFDYLQLYDRETGVIHHVFDCEVL